MFSKVGKTKRKVLRAAQGNHCFYCGREFPNTQGWTKGQKRRVRDRHPTIDHIIPRSRGGGNNLENLCRCCRGCNTAKDNRLPWEWLSPVGLHRQFGIGTPAMEAAC